MGNLRHNFEMRLYLLCWCPVCLCVGDCVYNECYCSTKVIQCSYFKLQEMPQLNTTVATVISAEWNLFLDGNNISSIPSGSLPANLTDIELQENPITTIDDNVFDDSVNTLLSIFMSKVRFTKFPSAIGRLCALTQLSIINGNITDWNDGAWTNLSETLEVLVLENVGMTTWPAWTQYFIKLIGVTITYATFSTMPDNALDGVNTTLTDLNLDNNMLTMVPKAISNLTYLQTLSMIKNHITNLDWIPHNNNLNSLSLNNNEISNASHLSWALLPVNESLYTLDINYNLLTAIPEFSFLTNVDRLDFSHNNINDPHSGSLSASTYMLDLSYNYLSFCPKVLSSLSQLVDLGLSYNNINVLHEKDFPIQVTSVDLGNNLITELMDTSFSENFELTYLQLNNNPLTTISAVAFQRLTHLFSLNLRTTEITRLPMALSYLRRLVFLDVSNCTELVCTCMESSLAVWVRNRGHLQVAGKCGQISVSDFFSMLSPDCPSN